MKLQIKEEETEEMTTETFKEENRIKNVKPSL
jgi:hypothetical protein